MRHVDLFSGIGGFALALDSIEEFDHTFVECEQHLQNVLNKNWEGATVHGDIRDFRPLMSSPFLVTGGFPCQDISRANKNKNKGGINGERSGLWAEFFRVLGECRPRYCIVENVSDLLSNGIGTVLHDLASIGYDSAYTTIDSRYCGVPQRRRRVYILGVRDGITKGADIFQCEGRSRTTLEKTNLPQEITADTLPLEKEGQPEYYSIQKTGEYKQSDVASTIRKCGWAIGGDLIVGSDAARHMTYKEKLKLQGIPPDFTENCNLTLTQKHSANGMTIPAVKWVMERMFDYDKTLDV